jgi:FdhD protein
MARRRTERMMVTKVTGLGADRSIRPGHDELIVEEPMSLRLDGTLVATTMRTPGHDDELAAGFCFTEGLLAGAPITGVRCFADDRAADGVGECHIVDVETGGQAPQPRPRLGNVSSSCGWCGSEQLDDLCLRLAPLRATAPIDLDVVAAMPDRVLGTQGLFERTGSVHAAAAFGPAGDIVVMREDVGRHNAVDKVIGSMLLDPTCSMPATGLGLFVSGRASIEMVQKAWAAGFSTLVAVSAPTSLAVEAARRAGLVLAGFVRGSTFNIYSPE